MSIFDREARRRRQPDTRTPLSHSFGLLAFIAVKAVRGGVDTSALARRLLTGHVSEKRIADYERLCKASIASIVLDDLGFDESPLTSFISSLTRVSAFDRLLPLMQQVPLRTRVGFITSQASGDEVAEGKPKPISTVSIGGTGLVPRKAVSLLVCTDEALSIGLTQGAAMFEQELVRAVGRSTDEQFIEILTDGATSAASTDDPLEDLGTALAAMPDHAGAAYAWLVAPRTCKQLATYPDGTGLAFPGLDAARGGQIAGVEVIPTDGLPTGTSGPDSVIVDASLITAGTDAPEFSVARHTSIEMQDSQTLGQDPAAGTGASLVSLWQNNLVAARVERFFSAARTRTAAVRIVTDVDYTPPA